MYHYTRCLIRRTVPWVRGPRARSTALGWLVAFEYTVYNIHVQSRSPKRSGVKDIFYLAMKSTKLPTAGDVVRVSICVFQKRKDKEREKKR